jgi:hypothetical protein
MKINNLPSHVKDNVDAKITHLLNRVFLIKITTPATG